MKKVFITLAFISFVNDSFSQTNVNGAISITSKSKRALRYYNKIKKTGEVFYYLKAKKSDSLYITELLLAELKLFHDGDLIAERITKNAGEFHFNRLLKGSYRFTCRLNKRLQLDTTVFVSGEKKNLNLKLKISDDLVWAWIDSVNMAKFPYNAKIAKQDLKTGKVFLLNYGLGSVIVSNYELNKITEKYGFKYAAAGGCVRNYAQDMAIKSYNKVVYKYLNTLNKPGWREHLKAELKQRRINEINKRYSSVKEKKRERKKRKNKVHCIKKVLYKN